MSNEQLGPNEKGENLPVKAGDSKRLPPTLDELERAYQTGNKSFVMNELAKNIDGYSENALPKEYFDTMADLDGKGGSPGKALHNFDKFNGMTAQEAAITLITYDHAFPVFDLENDLKDKTYLLDNARLALNRKITEGYSEGDEAVKDLQAQVEERSKELEKVKKVLSNINKREILDQAAQKQNLLIPEKMQFFMTGEQALAVDYNDLISKMLENYSVSYLYEFVNNAPDGSLSPDLARKLEAKGGILDGISQTKRSKFVGK